MNKTSIDQLPLSVRAKNVLHRMGIHYANELVVTPLEVVAQQRHAGVKTLDEIKYVIENIDDIIEYSARDCAARPLKLSIHSGGIEHACRRR